MFSNCGKSIKNISVAFFCVGIVSSFALAITVSRDSWSFHLLPFLAILAVGGFLSYLFTIFIYGFGIIVENSEKQMEALEEAKSHKNETDAVS